MLERAEQVLSRFLPRSTLCVGLSGGLDSVVLLHLLAEIRSRRGFLLRAVYVNHGLSPHAGAWADFAVNYAASLGVECRVEAVSLADWPGLGVEGAARAARYTAFARQNCDLLLLAQHRNDQAETVLLNLMRGSGLRGLAAMPEWRPLNDKTGIVRPLLGFLRAELEAYAAQHQLSWVEDESNLDCRYDRNFLRNQIIPELAKVWPGVVQTLSRVALHAAEADALLQELAADDLKLCVQEEVFDLQAPLSPLRLRNALRSWLTGQGVQLETRAFEELMATAMGAAQDAQPALIWRQRAIRRYRQKLYITAAAMVAAEVQALPWSAEMYSAPWHGRLIWRQAVDGIAPERLIAGRIELRPRLGGEVIRLASDRPQRTLKHLFQENAVPPWLRLAMPLIYLDGELAAVPGVAVAAAFRAQAETALAPFWLPD